MEGKDQAILGSAIILFLIATVSLGIFAVNPPEAAEESQQAVNYLTQIAHNPSPIGSSEHEGVRNYLYDQLIAMGLEAEIQSTTVYNPSWRNAGHINNVLAKIPGTDSSGSIVLVAHYDTVNNVPGAANAKSGIATVLQTAGVVVAEQLKNDIVILFSDGGEAGMLGSVAFLEQHPWAEDIGLVINFSARGTSGPVMITETSRRNDWLIKQVGSAVTLPLGNSFINEINRWVVQDTDFAVFKQAGIDGVNLMFGETPHHYQTASDNIDNLDFSSLQHQGDYLYALINHFGNIELTNEADFDRVFFNIAGLGFISYPLTWVAHMLTIVLILFGFTAWFAVKKGKTSIKGILISLAIFFGSAFAATVISSVFTNIIQSDHPLYQYIPLNNGLWYLSAMVVLVAAAFVGINTWALKKYSVYDLILGSQVVWLLVTTILSLLLPGASYLFIWPFAFSLIAVLILINLEQKSWIANLIVLLISSLPILLLWPPMIKTVFLSLGFGLIGILMLLVALMLALLLPQLEKVISWHKLVLPVLLAVLFIVSIVGAVQTGKLTAENPAMDSLFYHIDLDTNQAYWASIDNEPDEFTNQVLKDEYIEANLGQFIPYEDIPVIATADPNGGQIDDPIEISLVSDVIGAESRELVLQVKTTPTVNNIIVFIEPEMLTGDVLLDGEAVAWDEHWPVIRYYNVPEQGISLTIPAIVDQQFSMQILTQSLGLPQEKLVNNRPEYLIATPTAITDSIFTIKTYEL